ncbi:MAG: DivIVA domain-containing protein [Gaiellaceae bacterium]
MALTPVEIRHLHFARRPFGYPRGAVELVLEEIADSFEDVWRDRADLTDKVEQLESDLVRYRELETLLRTTLVSAERAAHDLKTQAKREADLIIGEAHSEARSITRQAAAERERLLAETIRLRALMRAALTSLDEGSNGEDAPKMEAA